jgi:hypothetical protein
VREIGITASEEQRILLLNCPSCSGSFQCRKSRGTGLGMRASSLPLSKADEVDGSHRALPHPKSDFAFFRKHALCGSCLRFQPANDFTDFPWPKNRKHLYCVERVRFLVRQPGDSLSSRQRCLAQDISKGGERGRRIETANQARITRTGMNAGGFHAGECQPPWMLISFWRA